MDKRKGDFVPLSTLRGKAPTPQETLAEIRRIYFRTRPETIHADLAHAIALLKTLPTEDDQEKAAVYMDGLSQMRSEWRGKKRS